MVDSLFLVFGDAIALFYFGNQFFKNFGACEVYEVIVSFLNARQSIGMSLVNFLIL